MTTCFAVSPGVSAQKRIDKQAHQEISLLQNFPVRPNSYDLLLGKNPAFFLPLVFHLPSLSNVRGTRYFRLIYFDFTVAKPDKAYFSAARLPGTSWATIWSDCESCTKETYLK